MLHEHCRQRNKVQSIFAMTPYFYRASKEGHERLAATDGLCCKAEMDIHIFRKPL